MQQIILFRHARANQHSATGRDADRTLSAAGRKQAARAASGLKRLAPRVDLIVTSALPRARATAQAIASRYRPRAQWVEHDALAPDGEHRPLFKLFAKSSHAGVIVCVGHEPDLSRLAGALLGAPRAAGFHLTKAGACMIAFDDKIKPGKGQLAWWVTADMLERLK